MDINKKTALKKRIETVGEALQKNNMEFYYAETAADVKDIVCSLMPEGCSVTHGGSVSMKECGIPELLNSGKYNYIDRSKATTPEEAKAIYRQAFSADVYITSANAISKNRVMMISAC